MLYQGSVVGTTFEPAKTNILVAVDFFRTVTAAHGDVEPVVTLKHNPLNPYDKNAIEVHIGYDLVNYMVGHIPKTHNVRILEAGIDKVKAELERFYIDALGNAFGLSVIVNKENAQVFSGETDKLDRNNLGVNA